MNYIDSVKQQIKSYITIVLVALISHGVTRYFTYDYKSIIFTSYHIGLLIGGTLSHIFFMPLYLRWFNSLK
jgi:hypothetical protein